ncbi:MAG: OmpH family outer membrane protein [Gluconacetobacter diazotrophicus]|nr:OmpH family outer membrane protein [Gluconacetobacter diazotrophicus]
MFGSFGPRGLSRGAFLFAGGLLAATALMPAPLSPVGTAAAQQSGGWFVPKSGQPAAPADSQPAHRRAPAPQARPAPPPPPIAAPSQEDDAEGQAQGQNGPQTAPVLPLPPVPTLGDLPKAAAPPAPVMGVISVPDIMRQASAAQQVEQVLGARREKLNQDAQKEQQGWRATQQEIQGQVQSGKIKPDQAQARANALRSRVQAAQKEFQNRNRIIQEAAQVSIGQIERELVQVIKQVSAAHGMNLVLHREQVALNMPDFDITAQALDQLNRTLPSVFIPADGQDPEQLAKSGTYPTTANPGPQPVSPATPQPAVPPPPAAAPKK